MGVIQDERVDCDACNEKVHQAEHFAEPCSRCGTSVRLPIYGYYAYSYIRWV